MRRIVVATVALVGAITLAACSSTPTPTPEPAPALSPTAASSTGTEVPADADVTIRPLLPGYDFEDIANTLRSIPAWSAYDNDNITVLLNGTCDALDVLAEPQSAIDYLSPYDIHGMDMFMGLSAAATIFCPEHAHLLT